MAFIEKRLARYPTNWWVPNTACSGAMLRSAGFDIVEQPTEDVFLCRRSAEAPSHSGAVYPAKGAGA